MDIEAGYLALLLAVSFVSSILGAASGFGGGLLIIPFLAPAVGIKGVIPALTIAMILGNLSRACVYRTAIRLEFLKGLSVAVIPGVIVGTLIYDARPAKIFAVVIGIALIGSIPLRRALKGRVIRPTPARIVGVGLGFGIVTGATTGAGVILISLLLGMGLSGPALIGTDAVIGVLISIVRTMMFGTLDLLDTNGLTIGLLVGLTMMPGAYLARWLLTRVPVQLHIATIEALICVAGLTFLCQAYTGP